MNLESRIFIVIKLKLNVVERLSPEKLKPQVAK